jgi:hypothetical protein
MNGRKRLAWGAAALAAAAAVATGIAVASGAGPAVEDDLAVVKRAVAQSTQVAPDTPATSRTPDPEPRPEAAKRARASSGKQPSWLKVRVTEKGTSRKKVTVNLPLALVRALDDGDFPIDFGCWENRHRRCSIKLAEVLDALESGQDLVEVDDEDQLVRIWVE